MSNNPVPHYEQPEEQQAYYKEIVELLDHYEDGWNLFINAHKAKDYDYPLIRKPEHEDNPYIPDNWILLVDTVCQIIATKKYELDVLPNTIEIIRADQMLDAYTTTGLPESYRHWSFGKRRMIEEQNYDSSKHLAYEIVINSDPCLAYCMDSNSPLLQMLVIAHASYGHNAVFKNNYLFQDFTDTEMILTENRRMKEYIYECEQRYGWEEVSRVLDFCHSMQFVDTSDKVKKQTPRRSEILKRQQERRLQEHLNPPRQSVFNIASNDDAISQQKAHSPYEGEKNILGFMADHAPHMPEWKRNIMRMRSRLSQYFKPQMMTKVLNEGMATFTHDKVLTTMRDIGLIDWGMYQEYQEINAGVLYQQSGIRQVKTQSGEIVNILVEVNMNPYTLGLKILQEVERICKNPTEEDKQWFHFAGDPDWLSVVKHAVFSSDDETFIHQYLSPQAIRDLGLFTAEDDDNDPNAELVISTVTAIHANEGFKKIRELLARDYRFFEKLPNISLYDYQDKTDRCLILRHEIFDNKRLHPEDTQAVLEYMHSQWEHPIVIESVDEKGKVVEAYSSPPNYDYKAQRRIYVAPGI
ncbi:MAG: SpoVR family protein [Alphaproteobacteria bacterium]|nr:SpoVR family protein [Alphaproteobacteria bacterium]MCD8563009.1 SpoVR family protein [Alphaproteobacteria bacterium]